MEFELVEVMKMNYRYHLVKSKNATKINDWANDCSKLYVTVFVRNISDRSDDDQFKTDDFNIILKYENGHVYVESDDYSKQLEELTDIDEDLQVFVQRILHKDANILKDIEEIYEKQGSDEREDNLLGFRDVLNNQPYNIVLSERTLARMRPNKIEEEEY